MKPKALKITEENFFTYEDYANLPEGAPFQLIGGKLVMTPAPSPYHQMVLKKLGYLLYEFAEKRNNLGEVFFAPIDVYFDEKEVYQPDIVFITKERLDIVGEKKIESAPDLVIEIISEATAYYDLRHKKNIYEKYGVKEYWIVDPIEKSIEVYENSEKGFVLISRAVMKGTVKSSILRGFEVSLEEIF